MMLSSLLRRALLRPAMLPTAQILSLRPILSNRFLALSVRRSLATTSIARDAESTEPEPAPKAKSKPKPKATRKKSASTTKASAKRKGNKPAKRPAKKVETKKITIGPQDLPPKPPGSAYILWLTEWRREQPKIENLEHAKSLTKEGAQTWHTVSDYEKQRYREKYDVLQAEYKRRMEDWREQVDPRILKELNRRRVAKGRTRIRAPATGRPLSGFFRYLQHVREEYARTEDTHKAYLLALTSRASSQWKAMGDAEKAKYNDPARADFAAWREKRNAESQAKE